MSPRPIAAVVKVGGSLLDDPPLYASVAHALGEVNRRHTLLVVPGGGPMADAVRALDVRMTLGDDVAHWMAVLAMDQHALLLAARIGGSALVESAEEIAVASGEGRLAVLAPSRWLRRADPLPHSWSVTSDSIAAWVAAAVGAPSLVLIKSSDAPLEEVVDEHFASALDGSVRAFSMAARRIGELGDRLGRR